LLPPFSEIGRDISLWQAKKEDILSRFLLEREQDPGCFDNKYLRDIILNFVIAGRDTTAGTMAWFLYELCRNQHIQEKIALEVRAATATVDRDVGVQEFVALLTEDAISRMQYLHAALTETLRLYPAVPIVSLTPQQLATSLTPHAVPIICLTISEFFWVLCCQL
jgi:cytochrome P450